MTKAFLFDLDGTLADTHGLIMQCYEHTIQTHLGRPMRREIWERLVGLPLDDTLTEVCAFYDVELTPALFNDLKQTYRAHMRANCDDVRAFPGVIEMLNDLRERGLRMAIVTTKFRHMAVRHLETSGMTEYFEFIVPGDEVTHPKPNAEPFLRALELLNLPPEQVAHVGDSAHDITGAKAASIYAIAALWGTDNKDALLSANPDLIISTPDDLLQQQQSSR